MTIKFKDIRAAELRQLADMVENGEIKALVVGISIDLPNIPNLKVSYMAGDLNEGYEIITKLDSRIPTGFTPAPLPDGQSLLRVATDAGNEETDQNGFEALEALKTIISLTEGIVKG